MSLGGYAGQKNWDKVYVGSQDVGGAVHVGGFVIVERREAGADSSQRTFASEYERSADSARRALSQTSKDGSTLDLTRRDCPSAASRDSASFCRASSTNDELYRTNPRSSSDSVTHPLRHLVIRKPNPSCPPSSTGII